MRRACTSGSRRKINCSPFEPVCDRAKARQESETFATSMRLRWRVERLFACIKQNNDLRRVRLRGWRGTDEQFLLAATVRNLRQMAKTIGVAESGPA